MIYAIGNTVKSLVKFGYAGNDVKKRLRQIQTGCPHALEIIAVCDGSLKQEKHLHYLLQSASTKRPQGEWYSLRDGIIRDTVRRIESKMLPHWMIKLEEAIVRKTARESHLGFCHGAHLPADTVPTLQILRDRLSSIETMQAGQSRAEVFMHEIINYPYVLSVPEIRRMAKKSWLTKKEAQAAISLLKRQRRVIGSNACPSGVEAI